MKVIFLDVDGVLNYDALFLHPDNSDGLVLSPEILDRFCNIVKQTDAKVILSSSWRHGTNSLELITRALADRGVIIYATTPVTFGCHRGQEIELWLNSNNLVDRFAILDDDKNAEFAVDNILRAEMKGHFFCTDFDIGLTEDIARQVINWLNWQK